MGSAPVHSQKKQLPPRNNSPYLLEKQEQVHRAEGEGMKSSFK